MNSTRGLPAYLIASYPVSWLAHVPVHGLREALIPAMVPWGVAALVALLLRKKKHAYRYAFSTLALSCVFFLVPHVWHHG